MKKNIFYFIFCFLILLLSSFCVWYFCIRVEISFVKNSVLNLNQEVFGHSLILSSKNLKFIDEDFLVDTSLLGKQTITIEMVDRLGRKYDYEIEIEVIDDISPVIEAQEEILTYVHQEVDLLKDVFVYDNSKEELIVSVEGTYSFEKVGEYVLNYVAIDSSGNKTEKEFRLFVQQDPKFLTSKGYTIEEKDGITYIDGILIANKTYSLPSSYGNGLTNDTLHAFQKMKNEASEDGISIQIISGYRSFQKQKSIYENYVSRDGKEKADTYSARAGHSEHQTGLAFDLNSLSTSFANTKEGIWLHHNAHRFGFILRYPEGKKEETGYMYEPWHFRYVGVELATKLYNQGDWISLEDYFGITSKY